MAIRSLVFVPGFLASNIFRPMASRPDVGEMVWMSYQGIILGDYKWLDPTYPGSQIEGGSLFAGYPLEAYHRGWSDFSRVANWNAYSLGYDFRRSTVANAATIADLLALIARGSDEVAVVAHSMGGLVVARCWELIPRKLRGKFKRFVTLGTPWEGSFATLGYLCGHGPTLQKIALFNSYGLDELYRKNVEYLKRMLARWPGVYDLIPSPSLIAQNDAGRELEPWSTNAWAVSNPDVDQRLLNAARNLHKQPYRLPDGMRHLCIVGRSGVTIGPMPQHGQQGYYRWAYTVDGDGVVPGRSALSPFGEVSKHIQVEVDHESLPNREIVHWHVLQFLNGS